MANEIEKNQGYFSRWCKINFIMLLMGIPANSSKVTKSREQNKIIPFIFYAET